MKNIVSIIAVTILLITNSTPAFAVATPTPSPSTSPTNDDQTQAIDQKLNELKNKISNKVAQLKLVEKRGFLGTVTESTSTQITLTDIHGAMRYVDVDELTKFSSSQIQGTFGISDIKKGMLLEILGLYNKESEHTLARVISYETEAIYIHGTVTSIDNANRNVTVTTDTGKSIVLSMTTTSKIETYTKADGLTKANFAAVEKDQHVIASGFSDKTQSNTIDIGHMILFTELPKDPRINVAAASNETPIPTKAK